MKLSDLVEPLIGKTLLSLEYGSCPDPDDAEEEGTRYLPLGRNIVRAYIGVTEGDRDPCVWMELDDGTEVYAYDNEEISVAEPAEGKPEGEGEPRG